MRKIVHIVGEDHAANTSQQKSKRNLPLGVNDLLGQTMDLLVRSVIGLETFLPTEIGR